MHCQEKDQKSHLLKTQGISMSPQYVSVYNASHVIEYKNKFNLFLIGLSLSGAILSSSAHAEVRKYDPADGSGQITLPRETSVTAPEQPQNQPQMDAKPALLPGVTSNTTDPSAYVAELQLLKPKDYKLGSARIFINADDLSPELMDHLQQIRALDDLHSEIYFQDVKPAELAKLYGEKLKDYPKDLEFNVDFNGTLANELHVKGQNVMVYTDAKGNVAQYELKSDYSFTAAIERIKQGVAQ